MVSERASQQTFFGVSALLFVASAALTTAWCGSMSAMGEMPMPGGWTMAMAWVRMPGQTWPGAAASFLRMWVVMMVAMMLPSLVPALWRYRQARRDARQQARRSATSRNRNRIKAESFVGHISWQEVQHRKDDSMNTENKTILITGANRGIGRTLVTTVPD